MPEIGEEIRASEIGRGQYSKKFVWVGQYSKKFVWVLCPVCREERWAHKASTLSSKSRLCRECSIRSAARQFHL